MNISSYSELEIRAYSNIFDSWKDSYGADTKYKKQAISIYDQHHLYLYVNAYYTTNYHTFIEHLFCTR